MSKTIPDDAFAALQTTVGDIDFLCKRLTEWRALGMTTAIAESRLDVFLTGLRGADDPPSKPQLADLRSMWADCARQIEELALLPQEYQAITRSRDNQSPDPTVTNWLEEVVARGRVVDKELAEKSFGDLKNHSDEYKTAYRKLSIQRDARINVELKLLTSLANELRFKFQ
jgi:hypothetical protein